ncbi:hypothetical protein Bamb_3719 [Burkholderia ambifaria AMMD]|uniref:Uncharacterized protein n=1 Tax=Burkholderia ambifaria (strain ATCC BAA-244 / DSM 16087 / CCUG 44356 / LMG 19182 / AMMD) TaxID=339670 RepID=Q0B9A0_BURCM|nr:hypothetical protein Bamb_3719 [Burkholderia ambifaria AMMD]
MRKGGNRAVAANARGPEPDRGGKFEQGGKTDESSVPTHSILAPPLKFRLTALTLRERVTHIGAVRLFQRYPSGHRCRTRRPCGARPGKRINRTFLPPAGGHRLRSARQACVRLGDDFAVLEVQCPCFCKQFANTCEPASGLGGTIGNVRRLHDEAPYRWRVRDNPNHRGASPLCEMRFRYMRITDNLCCCSAT